jgi:phosphoglycerol transferase MdoB-like AlkP superfamily enzyme
MVGVQQLKFETVGHHKTPDASFLLALKNFSQTNQFNVLRSSVRKKVIPVLNPQAPDILFYLGESLSKQHLKIYGSTSVAAENMDRLFSQPNAVAFKHGLTNSSATDVSLPSLLSGVGPEESDIKLHEMPLLWDWLKAAGYYTVFVSPQKFSFSSMDNFFMSPGPDRLMTADRFNTIQRMVTHNNGIDDILAAKITLEDIKKDLQLPTNNTKPIFILYFSNATHYPFVQTSTELDKQPQFKTKYENSLFIADQTFKILHDFILNRNRSHITLISADHGEVENTKTNVPRISSFYDEILSVPWMWNFSSDLMANEKFKYCLAQLKKSSNETVHNLDILPTLVDLVGMASDPENQKVLKQLQGASLCDPNSNLQSRSLIGLNTNNIRQWNPEGFLVAQNQMRFVYSNTEGPQIFDVNMDPKQVKNLFSKDNKFFVEVALPTIEQNLHLKRIWDQLNP